MSAEQEDETNVTPLRPVDTPSRKGQSSSDAPRKGLCGNAKNTGDDATSCGEVFAFPGNISDAETRKIAVRLCEHMNLNFNLCCQLEHIADGLPDNVDKQECLYVARSILPVVKLAHEFEETVLFPVLREKLSEKPELEQTLERLKGEHWEDESYASEIHHSLITFVSGLGEKNIDSLGYMLRGFFEGMRRHLAFEREHVLPLLRQVGQAGQMRPAT